MTRPSAICLLLIFLTYHFGYYAMYLSIQHWIKGRWQENPLEMNPGQYFVVSTPLSLPYRADQSTFHPASGLIRVNDQFFRLIKYRYATDTLYLVLVADKRMEELHQYLRDWAVSFTSIPISQKGTPEWWKSMCREFLRSSFLLKASLPDVQKIYHSSSFFIRYLLFYEVPSPPPKSKLIASAGY